MKNTTLIAFGMIGALSAPAFADNATVEDAIRSRSDLSNFYQAMVNTGVNRELQPGQSYTVFAPTNDAFAEIPPDQYPCFYAAACRPEVADIVRNHIVPEEVNMSDAVGQRGGLYSIDKRFIAIGEPSRNSYTVDGNNITSTNQLMGSVLYKIDGVIAKDHELAAFQYLNYAYVPSEQVTTTTRRTIIDPSCDIYGNCPAAGVTTETTTVTQTAPGVVHVPVAIYPTYQ